MKNIEHCSVNELRKYFIIQTIIMYVLILISLILCFKGWKLAIKYEELRQENENLIILIETQKDLINDYQTNCKDLFVENQKLKFGGNVE